MYTATLVSVKEHTPLVKSFKFTFPELSSYSYKPGQFVMIEFIGQKDEKGKPIRRHLSLASTPLDKDHLEVCVKVDGKAMHQLDSLGLGGFVRLSSSGGDFILPADFQNEAVFIAMGTGIAPIMSMLRTLWKSGFSFKHQLIYGIRSEEDIIYEEELCSAKKRMKNFSYSLSFSQKKDSASSGYEGRITAESLHLRHLNPQADYFLCGHPDFVKSLFEALVHMGVASDKIHREQW